MPRRGADLSELGSTLAEIRHNEEVRREYALTHIDGSRTTRPTPTSVEYLARLCPAILLGDATKAWLLAWFCRHLPEGFAGRPEPTF
jgi:hypothetical protein